MPGRVTFTWTCDGCGFFAEGYSSRYDIFDAIPLGTGLLSVEWEWRSGKVYCPGCRIIPIGSRVHVDKDGGYDGTVSSILITADETLYGVQRNNDGTVNMVAAEHVRRE